MARVRRTVKLLEPPAAVQGEDRPQDGVQVEPRAVESSSAGANGSRCWCRSSRTARSPGSTRTRFRSSPRCLRRSMPTSPSASWWSRGRQEDAKRCESASVAPTTRPRPGRFAVTDKLKVTDAGLALRLLRARADRPPDQAARGLARRRPPRDPRDQRPRPASASRSASAACASTRGTRAGCCDSIPLGTPVFIQAEPDLTAAPPRWVTSTSVKACLRLPGPARRARRGRAPLPGRRGRARRRRRLLPGGLHRGAARLSRAAHARQPARLAAEDRAAQGDRRPPRRAPAGRCRCRSRPRSCGAEPAVPVDGEPGLGARPRAAREAADGGLPAQRRRPLLRGGRRRRSTAPQDAARRNVHEGLKKLREELVA